MTGREIEIRRRITSLVESVQDDQDRSQELVHYVWTMMCVERGLLRVVRREQSNGLVRLVLEERAGFSPDGLIGLEANLRFAGPETMETKIFSRLSAWQNWIFQRPNATGPEGALKLYGTGKQAKYDRKRA